MGEIGYKVLQRPNESEKYYCVGVKMRRPFRTRYLTVKESVEEMGGVATIVSSSAETIPNDVVLPKPPAWSRPAHLRLRGYKLHELGQNELQVVFIESINLGGFLPQDFSTRVMASRRFREVLKNFE